MPLPFILAGAAIAAAGFGAKKAHDGYKDSSMAEFITKQTEFEYQTASKEHEAIHQKSQASMNTLGEFEMQIGGRFNDFEKLANDLLKKINAHQKVHQHQFNIPQHQITKIERFKANAVAGLAQVAGGGAAGAGAAFATYSGVMALATASTGTSIASLSGVAASNAALAAIGGGSLATGGLGMAGGTAILGGVVAAPVLLAAGWAYSSYAEKKLDKAFEAIDECDKVIDNFKRAAPILQQIMEYSKKIHHELQRFYGIFIDDYFIELKKIDKDIASGVNIETLTDYVIQKIENGYLMMAILTDIIITPIFKLKPKTNEIDIVDAKSIQEDDIFEKDEYGNKIVDVDAIDTVLLAAPGKVAQITG